MPQTKGEEKLLYEQVQKIITGSTNLDNIIEKFNKRHQDVQKSKSIHDPKYYTVLDTSIDILNGHYETYREDKGSINNDDLAVDIIELDVLFSWLEKDGVKNKTLIGKSSDSKLINDFLTKINTLLENINKLDRTIKEAFRNFVINYENVLNKLSSEILRLEVYVGLFKSDKVIVDKLSATLSKFKDNLESSTDKLKLKDGQLLTIELLDDAIDGDDDDEGYSSSDEDEDEGDDDDSSEWSKEAREIGRRVGAPRRGDQGVGLWAVSREPDVRRRSPNNPERGGPTIERRGREYGASGINKPKSLSYGQSSEVRRRQPTIRRRPLQDRPIGEIDERPLQERFSSVTPGISSKSRTPRRPGKKDSGRQPISSETPRDVSSPSSILSGPFGQGSSGDPTPGEIAAAVRRSPSDKGKLPPRRRDSPIGTAKERGPSSTPQQDTSRTFKPASWVPSFDRISQPTSDVTRPSEGTETSPTLGSRVKRFLKENVYDEDAPSSRKLSPPGTSKDNYDDLNSEYETLIKKMNNYESIIEQTKRRINTVGRYNADNFVYKLDDFVKEINEYEEKLSKMKDNYEEYLVDKITTPFLTFDSNKPEIREQRDKKSEINKKVEKLNNSIEKLKAMRDELDNMVNYITNKYNIELYGRDDINTQSKDIQDLYYKLREASRKQKYSPEYQNLCERAKSIHKKELNVDKRTKKYGKDQDLYEKISNELDKCYSIAEKASIENKQKAESDKEKEIQNIEKRMEQKYKLKQDTQQSTSSRPQPSQDPGPQPSQGPGPQPSQGPVPQPSQGPGPQPSQGPGPQPSQGPGPQPSQGPDSQPISSKDDAEKSEGLLTRFSPFKKKDNIKEINTVLNEKGDILGDSLLGDDKKETLKRVDNTLKASDDVNKVYYELLDEYYLFKKEANTTNNKHVRLLIKREKEIDELKNIIISLKGNLEQFRDICEKKALDQELTYEEEKEKINKESREVFDYLEDLFNEEIKDQLKELKLKLKLLKEDKKQLSGDKKLTRKKKRGTKKNKGKKKTKKKDKK